MWKKCGRNVYERCYNISPNLYLGDETMKTRFSEIPELNEITRYEKITAGWSFDEKYYIEQSNGEIFLLRLTPADKVERKQTEREIVSLFNQLDFKMSKVVGSGLLADKSYILYTWVEGCDLRDVIVSLDEAEQFSLGVQAGKILNAMHTIPVQDKHIPTINKLPKKKQQLRQYEESTLRIDDDDAVIAYVKANFDLFWSQPPTYRHGDFHTGNMLYTPEGEIGVIDFQRSVCGDHYEDFYKLQMFDVPLSIPFSIGYLKGYFNGDPDDQFWRINAAYVAHASLYSIIWALPFGESDVLDMKERALRNLEDFDGFQEIIPKWYREYSGKWLV